MTDTNGAVVVGVDGSANAHRAMRVAAHHAELLGVPLCVVHAVGLTEEVGGRRVPSFDRDEEIATMVDGWCEALREDGRRDYHVEIVDGPPVDVMLRVARREAATLVVVGRRGAGGQPDLRLGSTAHQMIEHSPWPVLVVPPIARTATATPAP